ncbi:MAG: DUF3987 domain-containing protein [Thermodesulfobacteriota bacterium]|nr:DUF3987 domain-containing protein [Thermodesulfobacteriota bacterium]
MIKKIEAEKMLEVQKEITTLVRARVLQEQIENPPEPVEFNKGKKINPILNAALEFIEQDFSIIPIEPRGKKPLIPWEEFQNRIATEEEVERWFEKWPDANIALVTGGISGVVAIDCDSADAEKWLWNTCPRTSVYQSTAKGAHGFFRPNGLPVKNRTGALKDIDVRGNGGYVVIAPSIHPTGKVYKLVYTSGLGGWDDLAEFPYELFDNQVGEIEKTPVTLTPVAQGQRDDALTRVAGKYFGRGMDSGEVLAMCKGVNLQYNPPLEAKEVEKIVASINRAEGARHTWLDPIPIGRSFEKPSPFPIDAVPKKIRNAIEEYRQFGQQPLALLASSALSVISLVSQGLADVERDKHLRGPISLNIIVIAESGERKTAADVVFSKSIKEWLADFRIEQEAEIVKNKADLSIFDAKRSGILSAIKSLSSGKKTKMAKNLDEFGQELQILEASKPRRIVEAEMFYGDVNPASLGESLTTGYPRAAIWSNEAMIVVGSHGMQKETVMLFLGMLNTLWDGQDYSNRRRTVENINIKGRRVNCSLMMQKQIVQELICGNNGLARGSGTLARFLITEPLSTIGHRPYKSPPDGTPCLAAFHARIKELLNLPLPLDEDGCLIPPCYFFKP